MDSCPFNLVRCGGASDASPANDPSFEAWRPALVPDPNAVECEDALCWLDRIRPGGGQPNLAACVRAAVDGCGQTPGGSTAVFLVIDDGVVSGNNEDARAAAVTAAAAARCERGSI